MSEPVCSLCDGRGTIPTTATIGDGRNRQPCPSCKGVRAATDEAMEILKAQLKSGVNHHWNSAQMRSVKVRLDAAEQSLAELWGILCPDAGPQDYAAIVREAEALKGRVAELEAAREWQPIETAPKDQTLILLYWPQVSAKAVVGWWLREWVCRETRYRIEGRNYGIPIHWQPLPAPPT